MSKKLPIGSGMHRAKRNRSRGPRVTPNRDRDAFLGMAALRLRKSEIENPKSKIAGGVH